jgi:hypothetical protein
MNYFLFYSFLPYSLEFTNIVAACRPKWPASDMMCRTVTRLAKQIGPRRKSCPGLDANGSGCTICVGPLEKPSPNEGHAGALVAGRRCEGKLVNLHGRDW